MDAKVCLSLCQSFINNNSYLVTSQSSGIHQSMNVINDSHAHPYVMKLT